MNVLNTWVLSAKPTDLDYPFDQNITSVAWEPVIGKNFNSRNCTTKIPYGAYHIEYMKTEK